MTRNCSGIRQTKPFAGHPCSAHATHFKGGKWWCKAHLPLDGSSQTDRETKTGVATTMDLGPGATKTIHVMR